MSQEALCLLFWISVCFYQFRTVEKWVQRVMALESDHIELANHNQELINHLLKDLSTYPDWVATIAFYKAIHIVEAVFDNRLKRHSGGHTERETLLKQIQFKEIFIPYDHLNAASRVARYLHGGGGRYKTFTDYMSADGVKSLLRKKLYSLEMNAIPLLSKTAGQRLLRTDTTELKPIQSNQTPLKDIQRTNSSEVIANDSESAG